MALKQIIPFNYHTFKLEVEDAVTSMVTDFRREGTEFWRTTLNQYKYAEYDYMSGEKVRLEFNEKLHSCSNQDELICVANNILSWGRMKPLTGTMKEQLTTSLSYLDSLASGENMDINKFCVDRLASITKIYEMWDLENWIIYDSFCVKGLQKLISAFWGSLGYRKYETLLKLPWPPGRSGFQISGFPRVADTAPRQKRLGFIYGSWLCRAISEKLRNNDGYNFYWRPYHIEMIAFNLGHEL